MSRGRYIIRFERGFGFQEACLKAGISTDLTGDEDFKRHVKRQVQEGCQEQSISTDLTGDLDHKKHVERQVYQQI